MKEADKKPLGFKNCFGKIILLLLVLYAVGFYIENIATENAYKTYGHERRFISTAKKVLATLRARWMVQGSDNRGTAVGVFKTSTALPLTTTPYNLSDYWKNEKNLLGFFILSVIASNSSSVSGFTREIELHGWLDIRHSNANFKCCLYWTSNKTTEYKHPFKAWRRKLFHLSAVSFSCPVRGSHSDIKGATLQFARVNCPADKSTYMKPYIPKTQTSNNSFAICLKILYGNVDSNLLLDWIEFYREMGVDKISMFVYNVTQETKQIINHYVELGVLEARSFDFPLKSNRKVGMKNPQVWQDEIVVLYDCYHRLHGYTYVAIVDLDEFLLPRKHNNIKDMMDYLMRKHPKAAGFETKSYIFNKKWNPIGRANGSDIVRYFHRTAALFGSKARKKNIILPARVLLNMNLSTHTFQPKPGFKRVILSESVGAVNHYRDCYPDLKIECIKRVKDTSILKVVDRFKNRTMWFHKQRHRLK